MSDMKAGSGRRAIPFRLLCISNLGVKYRHLVAGGRELRCDAGRKEGRAKGNDEDSQSNECEHIGGAFKPDLRCFAEAPNSPVKKAKQQRPRHPKPVTAVRRVTLLNAAQCQQPWSAFGLRPLTKSAAEAGRTPTCVFSSDNRLHALPA